MMIVLQQNKSFSCNRTGGRTMFGRIKFSRVRRVSQYLYGSENNPNLYLASRTRRQAAFICSSVTFPSFRDSSSVFRKPQETISISVPACKARMEASFRGATAVGGHFGLSNYNLSPIVPRNPIHPEADRSVTIYWPWQEYRRRY